MQRIIYSSRETEPMGTDALARLLRDARARNVTAGLTGMLLYSRGSFLQILEGNDLAALERTYSSICADSRHTRVRLLTYTDVDGRLFPDWTMGFQSVDDDLLAEHLEGFRPDLEYPLLSHAVISSGEAAEAFIARFAPVSPKQAGAMPPTTWNRRSH